MASVTCTHCGAVLKTTAALAPGKKVKCPKCSKAFVVPDDEEEPTPDEEPAAAETDDEEAEDEEPKKPVADEEDEEAAEEPKKKAKKKGKDEPKKKSSMGLVLGLVGGAVLLLCCCPTMIGGGWLFTSGFPKVTNVKDKADFAKEFDKGFDKVLDKGPDKTSPDKPAFTVTAAAISKEFDDDVGSALKKYKGKFIEVTGPIIVVTVDKRVVTLQGARQGGVDVICALRDDQVGKANLDPGMQAKIVGRVSTAFTGVGMHIDECIVTVLPGGGKKIEPGGSAKVSADQLAKEIEADAQKFHLKYRDQEVIVNGAVEKITKTGKKGSFIIQLRTQSKIRIFINLTPPDNAQGLVLGQPADFALRFDMGFLIQNNDFRIPGKRVNK
jgi:hypothetical protein